jgi:hypothetical protein
MDLPVELVQLLQHAGIEGQKLTWDLQVNSTAVSVKLVWIKAGKPVDKTGIATSQAQNKKHLSPSTRKRNALRISQWKAKRYEAVEAIKTCAETQTDDSIPITDESTQTEIHNDEQALHNPTTLTQIRERSTQTIRNFIGRQLTPTIYLIATEENRTPWNTCTTVRSPYIRDKLSYKTEFKDGSVSFSESFDPDDPTLIDRFPDYTTETDLGERPPTPTQQREKNSMRKASKKKKNMSAIPQ